MNYLVFSIYMHKANDIFIAAFLKFVLHCKIHIVVSFIQIGIIYESHISNFTQLNLALTV